MTKYFNDLSQLARHYTETGRPKHGSPEDRGAADRYYGRMFNPHWEDHSGRRYTRIDAQDMSRAEIAAYTHGFNNEEGQKDWGVPHELVEGECEERVND